MEGSRRWLKFNEERKGGERRSNTGRHPDVFELGSVVKKLKGSALDGINPVTTFSIVDKGALEIGARKLLDMVAADGGAKVPNSIDVHVLSEDLDEGITITRHDVDDAPGKIRGLKDLIEIGGRERSSFRGDDNDGVAADDCRCKKGDKGQERFLLGTCDANHSDGLRDADGGSIDWSLLNVSSVLVAEGGPIKESFDRLRDLLSGLFDLLSGLLRDALSKLFESRVQVLCNVIENLSSNDQPSVIHSFMLQFVWQGR